MFGAPFDLRRMPWTARSPPPPPSSRTIQPHNERAASVWSSGGRDYEEIIRGVYDGIDATVAGLAPQPGERILDVATGTGITARACARRGAEVTGIDIAAGLLDAARSLSGGLAIDYRLGDAEALPFADASFDAVVSTFGVMFVGRPEAAARELARVCRPGGRLALATWTPDGAIAEMFGGDAALHGGAPGGIALRLGPPRAAGGAAWGCLRPDDQRRRPATTSRPAARRPGTPSSPATARRAPWPPALTTRAAPT